MKNITLTTVGKIYYDELKKLFNVSDITIRENENKVAECKELFFYCSPEAFVAAHLRMESKVSIKELLKQWSKEISEALDNAIINPETCFLIDLEYVFKSPKDFTIFARGVLEVELKEVPLLSFEQILLAKSCTYLIEDERRQEIYEDLVAAADYLNATVCHTALERLYLYINKAEENFELNVNDIKLRNENESLNLLQVIHLQEELEETSIEKAQLKSINYSLSEELNRANNAHKELLNSQKKLETDLERVRSENNLALLDNSSLKNELNLNISNCTELNSRNNNLMSQLNSIKEQNKILSSTNETLLFDSNKNKTEYELTLLEVTNLQEELEVTVLENIKIKEEKQLLLSQKIESPFDIKALEPVMDKSQRDFNEIKIENELALLQIVQLQEELEFHFIKSQKLNKTTFQYAKKEINILNTSTSIKLANLLNIHKIN